MDMSAHALAADPLQRCRFAVRYPACWWHAHCLLCEIRNASLWHILGCNLGLKACGLTLDELELCLF